MAAPIPNPNRRVVEIKLTTENTVAGRQVRRNPAELTTSRAQFNAVKIVNANPPSPAAPEAGRIQLLFDRRQTQRTIVNSNLPDALRILPTEAALPAASLPAGRLTLEPGQSLEFLIREIPSGSHAGFNLNTDPPRGDNPDHVDYHWDC